MDGIRCGRCVAGAHEECVVTIQMGKLTAGYTWTCRCPCRTRRRVPDEAPPLSPAPGAP